MIACSPVSAPLTVGHRLSTIDQEEPAYECAYREAIGSLLCLATNTRPDILHSVTLLAKFCEKPRKQHWEAILRVMRCIKGTLGFGLTFKRHQNLYIEAFTDADWASDVENRKSVSGTLIFVAGGPVIFRSCQQSLVALSTTEAEFIAAAETIKELIWVKTLLTELNIAYEGATLKCDSQTAIRLIKNPEFHRRTKHIDIKYHFIRDHFSRQEYKLLHVSSENQLADFLTKALPRDKHAELVNNSGVKEIGSYWSSQ